MSEAGITIRPHSDKQERIIFSDLDLTIVGTGTQFGKTQAGVLWMQRQMFTFTEPSDNFLVCAPTYKILQQSVIPYFVHHLGAFGDYNKADSVFKLNQGGTVYMRTESDPDSIVGIPNLRAGWLDEAGKLRRYFWDNYLARAASKGARTLLTTSPYSLNWLYHDYIKPKLAGKLPEVLLIQAASWENPHHTLSDPDKRKKMQGQMDPRRFAMIFGGEWGRMQGLVYDCWDDAENYVNAFQLPVNTKYYGGIDWGYTDPFVLKVRAITPDGKHYGVSEFYKSGLTLPEQVEVARQKKAVYGIQKFFADPSQPGSIEEFNRNGLPTEGADNDIRRGIDLHYELIKTRKYKEFRGACPYTADERETYHYPEPKDLGPDDASKELLPVGQGDHTCLAAGTLIQTERGRLPIETVCAGDKVLTPLGYRVVTAAGLTGHRPLSRVEFSNGSSLMLTEDHPVFSHFKGFIPVKALAAGDRVAPCKEVESTSFLITASTDGMGGIGCLAADALMVARDCMWQFGNRLMGLFQVSTMSTTLTTTSTTTHFPTWNYSHSRSITRAMRPNAPMLSGSTSANTQPEYAHWPLPGTQAMRAERGTARTGGKSWLSGSQLGRPASTVKRTLKQLVTAPNIARTLVSHMLDWQAAWTTFKQRVQSAGLVLRKTSTPRKRPALINVVGVSPANEGPVYNLTIPSAGCFYANGILVSNCDTDRYITMMTYRTSERHTPRAPGEVKSQETREQRTSRLIKSQPRRSQTENWS